MDDSMINPILLSSSIHLENVEQLIKNLEKQTFHIDNFENILNNHNRQEIITKSFSSSTTPVRLDESDDDFLIKSITFPTNDINSFLTQHDGFTWDDTQANYRLTYNTDKSPQIRSQSNPPPPSLSSLEQQISNQNNSSGSSTSSSSTSWRQMKESQRTTTTTGVETKEARSPSPLSLYKIFQQKSHTAASRSTSQVYRQQNNSVIPNSTNKIRLEKSKSYNHLTTPTSIFSSSLHKSLPDLSFISEYSKELPRSFSTSPSTSINITRTTPSPILIQQQKQDSDRPRTLKSIKRYKNSKHSTEPLGVFFSPQLRKTFIQSERQQTLNLKSCLSMNSLNNLPLTDQEENQTKKSVTVTENIFKHLISPSNPSNDHLSLLTKRYKEMRRCQTDIIVVDPTLHRYSLTDSPPNEFCLQRDEDEEEMNIILNLDEPVPIINNPSDQFLLSMNNTSICDNIVERINDIIKRLFEIKRSDKTFFLNNELNLQLDYLLKNDLCPAIQHILEHGRKDLKRITLWKIIQISIDSSEQITPAYYEAKQIAQNISSHWLHRFQAFIFALLNKNELINWLYYFTRQKDITQRYYQSPDALILVSISSTFNLFERIMTQLEKLTSLVFHLTYHPSSNDNQMNTSMISTQSTRNSARDWVMTISRRSSKNYTQPINQMNPDDTIRSTLSRKFSSIFTKTNQPQPRKTSSVVTTKLPGLVHRPYLSTEPIATFQSKIPRPSLNVDKPKSARYRSSALPLK